MRYVLSAAVSGMFILVACPQQRLPQLQPQPPGGGPVTDTKTVVPTTISDPPSFNPGNLTITPTSNNSGGTDFIKEAGNAPGVKQYNIELLTDIFWTWAVEASAQGLGHRDILLESAFPQGRGIVITDNSPNHDTKRQIFGFKMDYREGIGSIEPLSIIIVARNKKYCREVFNMNATQGEVKEVNGVKPDVPKSEAACNTTRDGDLYNFDQRLRLNLQIKNVRDQGKYNAELKRNQKRDALVCGIMERIKANVLDGAQNKWGYGANSGNSDGNEDKSSGWGWGTVIGIAMDVGSLFIDYKISMAGVNCDAL